MDPTGVQVSDFFAFSAQDHGEWLSNGRTIDYGNKVFFSTGDVLYSNRSRPMATIVEDTCGRHDFLLTPCSQQTFDLLYPEFEGAYHPSCFENLCLGLAQFGVQPDQVSTTLNVFMNVWTDQTGRAAHRPAHLEGRRPFRPPGRDGPSCRPHRVLRREVQRRGVQADRLPGRGLGSSSARLRG